MSERTSPPATRETLKLDRCKGCGAVGLVEIGEVPLCARCLPNAYAIHLAEDTIKRAAKRSL